MSGTRFAAEFLLRNLSAAEAKDGPGIEDCKRARRRPEVNFEFARDPSSRSAPFTMALVPGVTRQVLKRQNRD